MKKCGIYKIESPSGKIYIGQSIDIEKRFYSYKKLNCKDQSGIYNSLKIHGVNNHKFEIICECKEFELNELEIYYINKYDSYNNGLNSQKGGRPKLKKSTYNRIDNTIIISTTYYLIWRLKDATNYGFTKNGICINTKTNKIIKKTLCGGSKGYCINGKFESENQLRDRLEKYPKEEYCPF